MGKRNLRKLNDILDEILNDKDAELYKQHYPDDWGRDWSTFKWLESTKGNVEKNSSGRNRRNGLYLGNTSGLHTLEARDWIDKKDDVRQIIGNQLTGWLLGNINAAIVLLTESEKKSIKESSAFGFGFTNEGNLEENEEETPKKTNIKEGLSKKAVSAIQKWIGEDDYRGAAKKIIDIVLQRKLGLGSSDLGDTAIFANGLDTVEEFLMADEYEQAFESAKETAMEMMEDEGFYE